MKRFIYPLTLLLLSLWLVGCLPVSVSVSGEDILSVLVETSEPIYGVKLVLANARCLDSDPLCGQIGDDAVFGLGDLEAGSRFVLEAEANGDVDCGLTAFSSPSRGLASIRNVPCAFVR